MWPGDYFNGFQKHKDMSIDSAMYYIRFLAAEDNYNAMLQDLLHNSFALSFQKMWEWIRALLNTKTDFTNYDF